MADSELHAIINDLFGVPVGPEDPGIIPTPVISRPPSLMELIWKIEPIPGSSCYYISADRGHAIDNNSVVFLSGEGERWKIIHQRGNLYSILKCSDTQRGWKLVNGQAGTQVLCMPLIGPVVDSLWRIDPPPPPPAQQD